MREHEQQAQLTRMRRIATGLLALMALVFLAARTQQARHPWLSFVGAFAEAAMVGALADWFAVTALFRRPFGLPIPHTAIIPENKDRIGESLGNFLQHNFMTREVLADELAQVDFAGGAARWLEHEENSRVVAAHRPSLHFHDGRVPALLRLVEDEQAAAFMRRALAGSLKDVRFAPLLGQVLSVLVAGGQHFVLLEHILRLVAGALEQNRPYIRQKVHENSPRWMPKAIDEKFFERLMTGVQSILLEIQGEDSEWRARFQGATEELIGQLASSPEYEAKLQALVARALGDPLFRGYVGQVWQECKRRLLADAGARMQARVAEALRLFGRALAQDAAMRGKLNGWMRAVLADAIAERRDVIAAVVKRVIRKWDGETVSRKLELQVGKDLQYIRINGTLVGGLVGLLLHTLGLLL